MGMGEVLDDLLAAVATTPALSVASLSRRHGNREVLRGIDLSLRRGEVVALLGAAGAGKSTLLRCLAATEPFEQGLFSLRGRPPQRLDIWRRSVGWLFQGVPAPHHLGLGQYLMQAPALMGRVDAPLQARELLARVGLAELFGMPLGQLTAAQRQRAAIAHALAPDPSVLLCDDITDPQDPEQAGEVGAAARSLACDGLSLLLATQDPALALHAHRVVILHEGRVQAMGAPAEMLQLAPWRARRRWFAPFTPAARPLTVAARAGLSGLPARQSGPSLRRPPSSASG